MAVIGHHPGLLHRRRPWVWAGADGGRADLRDPALERCRRTSPRWSAATKDGSRLGRRQRGAERRRTRCATRRGVGASADDYIAKAFEVRASGRFPAPAYYNDFNLATRPAKRAVQSAITRDPAGGLRIARSASRVTGGSIRDHRRDRQTISELRATGLKVRSPSWTEPAPPAGPPRRSAAVAGGHPYVNGLPDDVQQCARAPVTDAFGVFLKYRDESRASRSGA